MQLFYNYFPRFLCTIYPPYKDEGLVLDTEKLHSLGSLVLDDCEEEMQEGGLTEVEDTIMEEDPEEQAEAEYVEMDAVRKHQTDTGESTMMLPENIERLVKTQPRKSKEQSGLILAPGEDQVPRNILREKNPFVLHYPSLFPDGKGGLHDPERKKKITTQQWVMQRIANVNPVFAQNKPFLFSAVQYVEQQQLMSRMSISFLRGKMTISDDGGRFLQTEDGFNVFDGISGSPRYWQKLKYELIAKMEQLGVPTFFYTLSCANKRWNENAATILAKSRPDLRVLHHQEERGQGEEFLDLNRKEEREKDDYREEDENVDSTEEVTVPEEQEDSEYFVHETLASALIENLEDEFKCHQHEGCSRKSLNVFLDKKELNALQAEHVLDITRNFDSKVKSFRKNVLMNKRSPLMISSYHDRVEFQAR